MTWADVGSIRFAGITLPGKLRPAYAIGGSGGGIIDRGDGTALLEREPAEIAAQNCR